jgi:hypothetical protein
MFFTRLAGISAAKGLTTSTYIDRILTQDDCNKLGISRPIGGVLPQSLQIPLVEVI